VAEILFLEGKSCSTIKFDDDDNFFGFNLWAKSFKRIFRQVGTHSCGF
jgi:hypothetical protein